MLVNKRILLLSASLFGYQYEIERALIRQGAQVDYHDERPSNSFIVKSFIRINRKLIAKYIDQYHNNIIKQNSNKKYDYIFIIKGESISLKTLLRLRDTFPMAKLIMYHWDSIANNKNAISLLPKFDKVYSFDKCDCEKFGLEFLPLFYVNDYCEVAKANVYQDIDMLFIGTAHSDRYSLVKNLSEQFRKKSLKIFTYIYFPSVILYYKMKLDDSALRTTSKRDFQFESLLKIEVINLYKRTKIVVDIQHPNQTGLTMRCIETLGAKRKLITTNTHIKEYDFYNESNIFIIDRNNPVLSEEFFTSQYSEINHLIYEKYSIDNWTNTIFHN